MASKSTRVAIPAAVLAAAALALTGCSTHASHGPAGTTGNAAAQAPAPGSGGKAPDGSHDGTGTSGSGSGSGSGTAASGATAASGQSGAAAGGARTEAAPASAGAPCRSSQLKAARTGSDHGAGQIYAKITFTNTAATSCTLSGYPGVSYVKAAGVQSGDPAQRTGAGYHTVTLAAHGGTASAVMHDSNGAGGYSSGQCKLTSVKGIRVYPPNEKAAMYIPFATQHCAGTSVHPLTIGPVS